MTPEEKNESRQRLRAYLNGVRDNSGKYNDALHVLDEWTGDLIAAIESSQAENARLRAALEMMADFFRIKPLEFEAKHGIEVSIDCEHVILARIDAALVPKAAKEATDV